jgi:hypothetical protein
MDDKRYEAMLERYDDEEFYNECKVIESVFDVDDVEGTLLIEELDKIHDAIYRVLMKKYLSGNIIPKNKGAVYEFKLVNQ